MRSHCLFAVAVSLLLIVPTAARAADAPAAPAAPAQAADHPVIRLWQGDAPDAQGSADADIPTLTIYRAPSDKATGAAFVVCPGGGYAHLAVEKEGVAAAQFLNSVGVTAFVLKYRLGPKYHHPVEMHDAQRAIRFVRARASEWGVDPERVGIMGFSAGGHLASTAATHFDADQPDAKDEIDRQSCRPDLAILVYPVITLQGPPSTHMGSRQNLLGDAPAQKLVDLMSNDKQVTPQTPPCFLVHGSDDTVVPVENSLMFASACHQNKVPVELHVFEHGRHGFAMGGDDPTLKTWPGLAARWLGDHGFVRCGGGDDKVTR
jgi:acetyl esterase/lipase